MQRAAQAVTFGFAGLMAFEAALAAGIPLGDAAWGGAHAHLTPGQRAASAVAVVVWLAGIVVVRGRAAGRVERRYRGGMWGFVLVLASSGLMNLASNSPWEKYLLAPLALALAALCILVTRAPSAPPARHLRAPASDRRPRPLAG